mgnify:CR=1 FL=1
MRREGWLWELWLRIRGHLRNIPLPLRFYSVPEQSVEWGDTAADEFFIIKLKDKYARAALRAYANQASLDDEEYANEVRELADRSGPSHPLHKKPD